MTMPDKIWVYYGPNVTEVYNEQDADSTPYTVAPTTLDEAIRDYAMFGKFVAKMDHKKIAWFVSDWSSKYFEPYTEWPEYVAFVKEEMGK